MKEELNHVEEGLPQRGESRSEGRPAGPEQNRIYLVGSARLESQLLKAHIENHAGFTCHLVDDFEKAAGAIKKDGARVLLLRDCHRKSGDAILKELETVYCGNLSWTLCCLFNLEKETGMELEAVEHGVSGFLYEDEGLDHMIRCISAVFEGEIWLSRKDMSAYIRKTNSQPEEGQSASPAGRLTRRETEVLCLLRDGNSNRAIAETLFISPHTVKCHVYNIYKKIDVSNRLQAALWATQNLR